MQVPHILALLMSSHRLPLTKWQNLQPCFHDFQRSVLNTLDHKSKGKTAVGVFCISFLSTGQGMLPRLRSPLSSSFFQGQHPNFPSDAENLDRLQEKRKWLRTKHAIASSRTQFTGDTISRSRGGGVPVAQVARVAATAGLEQARRITVTARVTASAVLHPHQVWPMEKGINNHLFSLVCTSTITYLPQSVHQRSFVYLPLYTNNLLFASVNTATIICSAQYSSASVYTLTITCLPHQCINNHLFASVYLTRSGRWESTSTITCVPWSIHQQLLICLSLNINNHLFASVYTSTITCLPQSKHEQSLVHLDLYMNNCLFTSVFFTRSGRWGKYISNHLFALIYTLTTACLPQSSLPGLGDGESTSVITCVPALYINSYWFASANT